MQMLSKRQAEHSTTTVSIFQHNSPRHLTNLLREKNELALSLIGGSAPTKRTISERIGKGELEPIDYLNNLAAEELEMLKRDAPAESDSFPWISGRDDTYTTYPADYPFPEAIEAAKELSASATKRDRAADGPDSFPWIDARSVHKRDVAADGTDSFLGLTHARRHGKQSLWK
jgi:hypothetical protein